MDVFGMSEFLSTKAISSAAMNHNESIGQSAAAHDRSSNRARGWTRGWIGLRMLRVLVVAEELSSANALVRLMRDGTPASLEAPDSYSGVRVASAQDPDVVLLDLDLPLMDGCQVARKLRSDDPNNDCLILAVAERADGVRRRQCIDAGIDLLLAKPVDPEIVETLLLLERLRVNGIRAANSASRAKMDSTPFVRQKPPADERDRVASNSPLRPLAARSDNRR